MSATCRRHDTECRRLDNKTTRRHPTCGAKKIPPLLIHYSAVENDRNTLPVSGKSIIYLVILFRIRFSTRLTSRTRQITSTTIGILLWTPVEEARISILLVLTSLHLILESCQPSPMVWLHGLYYSLSKFLVE